MPVASLIGRLESLALQENPCPCIYARLPVLGTGSEREQRVRTCPYGWTFMPIWKAENQSQ